MMALAAGQMRGEEQAIMADARGEKGHDGKQDLDLSSSSSSSSRLMADVVEVLAAKCQVGNVTMASTIKGVATGPPGSDEG